MLREGDPARAAAAARAQEAGGGARSAGSRAARRTRPSRSSSSAIPGAARSRSRWITCAPVARTEAMDTLRAAVREDADNVDALRLLAQLYWKEKKQLSDAEALLRRVTQLAPGHTMAWTMLGGMLQEGNRHAEAMECYLQAIRLDPASAGAWSGLGIVYSHAGDVERGIEAFERAIALRPGSANVQLSYGHALKTQGRPGGGAARLSRRDRGEARFRRSLLEHGQPQGIPVRRRRGRRDGAAGRAQRPERERRHPLPLCAGEGLRGSG